VPLAPSIGLVLLSRLVTALVAAAVMISMSSFAKSLKQDQSYLTPLITLVVFPAVGMLPGIQLSNLMALIPVFNVSQLMKQIFRDRNVLLQIPAEGLSLVSSPVPYRLPRVRAVPSTDPGRCRMSTIRPRRGWRL
jgi:ABC-type Na+ efflux pump permease subunit